MPVDRFVQTFYVEADKPNVIFAAYRPVQAIVDADVWTREDGAIRASTVLNAGSIYTVVSARPRVTVDQLRGEGLIGQRLSRLGRQVLGRYLDVPDSTLRRSPSPIGWPLAALTYDVVSRTGLDAERAVRPRRATAGPRSDAVDDFPST